MESETKYICGACLKPKSYSEFYSNQAETKRFPKCKECHKLKNPQVNRECAKCKTVIIAKDFPPHGNKCYPCDQEHRAQRASITEKTCTKCQTLKPINQFPDGKLLDGKGSWCYKCSLSRVTEGSSLWNYIMGYI